MPIIFSLIILMNSFLFAQTIEAKYRITFGIVGEIGIAHAKLITNKNSYIITLEANSTGLAKALSGNTNEFFISQGDIVKNKYLPKTYKHIVTKKKKINSFSLDINNWKKVTYTYTKYYKFDHDNKKITLHKTKSYDKHMYQNSTNILNYYVKNDLLSLFFNLKTILKKDEILQQKKLYAVGANKQDGHINIYSMPNNKIKFFSHKDANFFVATIHRRIFSSENGELYIAINKDGLCEEAILKDVLFFGDIKGEMIEKSIR